MDSLSGDSTVDSLAVDLIVDSLAVDFADDSAIDLYVDYAVDLSDIGID